VLPESFTALAKSRYSVRDFTDEPVPDDVLDAILDDARHSPSWSNTRPYMLAVATGERLERLRTAYLEAFDGSLDLQHGGRAAWMKATLARRLPTADFPTWHPFPPELRRRRVDVGVGLYKHLGIERDDRAARDAHARRNHEFFGAPVVAWVFVHDDLLPFSAQDAGLMMQTLMLSAQARGVGSCPLGVLTTWRHPVDAEFVVPDHYKLITGLALGYASDAHVNTFRAEHPPIDRIPER
jgi:nitroreductase